MTGYLAAGVWRAATEAWACVQVKQWRLIIRNLPFSVDEPELIKYVGEAAFVWRASIPKDTSGKKRGFGVVSFTCRAHAAKAMEHVNSKARV